MSPELVRFIHKMSDNQADPEEVKAWLKTNPVMENEYNAQIHRMRQSAIYAMGGPIYQVPVASKEYCNRLITKIAKYDFSVNPAEEPQFQIDEAMLPAVDPEAYAMFYKEVAPVLNAYCLMMNSCNIKDVETVQVAKYKPDRIKETAWHHDEVSDFTAVISLNPSEYEGGGTAMRMTPSEFIEVPPLPKGHALIFNGRSVQHRGLEVIRGERLLLVCWCSTPRSKN